MSDADQAPAQQIAEEATQAANDGETNNPRGGSPASEDAPSSGGSDTADTSDAAGTSNAQGAAETGGSGAPNAATEAL